MALSDLVRADATGQAMLILTAHQRLLSPDLFATFLPWLLAELFQELPQAGDLTRPNPAFDTV